MVSQDRKLYILVTVAMPVVITAVVLAWGKYLMAIYFGIASAAWCILVIIGARRWLAEISLMIARKPLLQSLIILEKIYWAGWLAVGIVFEVKMLFNGAPLPFVLEAIFFVIITAGHCFFAPLVPGKQYWKDIEGLLPRASP